MKLRQIAEAAAYLSAHSPALIDAPQRRQDGPLVEFWLLSRHRLQDWTAAVDERLLSDITGADVVHTRGEPSLLALLDEIFVAEMLARIWAAAITAAHQRSGANTCERLVRHVFVGHLQARHRALSLITDGRRLPDADLTRLDQIRRRAERWTDVLLGHLVCRYGVEEFAFDAARAREFGQTQRAHGHVSASHPVWGLILAGLRLSFPDNLRLSGSQSDRNRSLASVALAMIPEVAARSGSSAPGVRHSGERFPALDTLRGRSDRRTPSAVHVDGSLSAAAGFLKSGDRLAFAKLRRPPRS